VYEGEPGSKKMIEQRRKRKGWEEGGGNLP
jgi:hypothetical protein